MKRSRQSGRSEWSAVEVTERVLELSTRMLEETVRGGAPDLGQSLWRAAEMASSGCRGELVPKARVDTDASGTYNTQETKGLPKLPP